MKNIIIALLVIYILFSLFQWVQYTTEKNSTCQNNQVGCHKDSNGNTLCAEPSKICLCNKTIIDFVIRSKNCN